jgi:hypothetical protein
MVTDGFCQQVLLTQHIVQSHAWKIKENLINNHKVPVMRIVSQWMPHYTNQGCECAALYGVPSGCYDSSPMSAADEAV